MAQHCDAGSDTTYWTLQVRLSKKASTWGLSVERSKAGWDKAAMLIAPAP
jgi:hypothetical protein